MFAQAQGSQSETAQHWRKVAGGMPKKQVVRELLEKASIHSYMEKRCPPPPPPPPPPCLYCSLLPAEPQF